jgi:hypothetical protein
MRSLRRPATLAIAQTSEPKLPAMTNWRDSHGFWDRVSPPPDRRGPPPMVTAPYAGSERRDGPRVETSLPGKIISGDGFLSPACVVCDLSPRGARVRIAGGIRLPPPVALLLTEEGLLFDAAVAWRRGDETGLVLKGCRDLLTDVRPEPPATAWERLEMLLSGLHS